MSAVWESLHRATLELASAEPIKQRVINAFSNHLKEMDMDSLPAELRPRFQALVARLTSIRPARGETAVKATVRKMSNEEARNCAQEIVELTGELAFQRSLAARSKPRQVVSLYSADG
jgi:hypothetical protein